METPPSDVNRSGRAGHLLRDIGRCASARWTAETPEQHLMRLSGDPLLVRELLQRALPSEPGAGPSLPRHIPDPFGLSLVSGSSAEGGIRSCRVEQYDSRSPVHDDSVFPTAFEVTAHDRREALDVVSIEPDHAPPSRLSWSVLPAAVILISFMLIVLLLMAPG